VVGGGQPAGQRRGPYGNRPAQPPGPPAPAGQRWSPGTPNACCRTRARRPRKPSSILLACHRPTPSAAGTACTFPAADPPGRACGRPLDQRYNAQHHTPQRGAVQPLADPVWALPSGEVFAAAGEPKQMHSLPMLSLPSWCARAEQVPGESGPGGPPPTCTMRTFSPPAAGRACGPDLREARRRLSAAPQRRRHPPGQSCRVRAPRWHADASRHQRIRPARAPLPGAAGSRLCGGG
jgi:hypothetical protein